MLGQPVSYGSRIRSPCIVTFGQSLLVTQSLADLKNLEAMALKTTLFGNIFAVQNSLIR